MLTSYSASPVQDTRTPDATMRQEWKDLLSEVQQERNRDDNGVTPYYSRMMRERTSVCG